jgi:fatty-acid peroxygenase
MKTKSVVLGGEATGSREAPIPRERVLDNSLGFLREGYDFIGNRCRRYGTDIFETRLLLTKATCVLGAEGARMFYGGDRFTRVGAMPITALKLLQDFGSVQLLDGEEHRHRKAMFVSIATPVAVDRLVAEVRTTWRRKLEKWQQQNEIVLFDELREILCRGVCQWAGLSLPESEVAKRTREFSEMIEASGSIGPRNWRAQWLRRRCERWIRNQVIEFRRGERQVDPQSPMQVIATHCDLHGDLLPLKAATVETINVLRATVAIAR